MLKNIIGKRKFVFLSLLLFVVFLPHPQTTWAFKVWNHEAITDEQLQAGECGFGVYSTDEVSDANFYTDLFEATDYGAHVDDNRLDLGSQRLDTKMKFILTSLKACKRGDALKAFGAALHTVQDIYAHSNAVDNNIVIPNLLGMKKGKAHCDAENGFTDVETEIPPHERLVTGYFKMEEFLYPCAAIHLSPPINMPAYLRCRVEHNECTGMPGHMCCHRELNKDEDGQLNGANYPEARRQAKAATLTYWNLVKDHITSNATTSDQATYFIKRLRERQRNTIFVIDDTGSMGTDLSKVKASVNQFIDSLVISDEAPTLGLVTFKDTVYPSPLFCDVEELRPKINALYASGGGDCPEVSLLALRAALMTAMGSTYPDEPNIGGHNYENNLVARGGNLILYTDASARNPDLGPEVKGFAVGIGFKITSVVTGDCVSSSSSARSALSAPLEEVATVEISHNDPVNTVNTISTDETPNQILPSVSSLDDDPLTSRSGRILYHALADQTGGVSFNVTRYEVDDVTSILLEFGAPDTEVFSSQKVALSYGETTIVEIPVDDSLSTRVSFMITGAVRYSRPSVTLKRPNGSVVNGSDTGVTLTQLSSVVNYAIDNPEVGIWRVELSGNGNFLVRAFGETDFQLNGLRLMRETLQPPRPEMDLIPIEGDPISNTEIVAQIRFTAAPTSVSMTLQRPDGSVISTPTVTSTDGVRRFQATFNVPNEPFLIKFSGQTAEGSTFHRESPMILMPQTVGIKVEPISATTAPESTAVFDVTVTNTGDNPATYVATGSSLLDWTVNTPSTPIVVQPGENQTFTVEVEVPADAELGTTTGITIFVQDVNIATVRNSAMVSLKVEGDNDSDDDGIPDDEDECEESNLESTIIIDECDSNVENTLFANGCSISDLVSNCADGSKNQGQFVSCVSKLTNDLKKDKVLSGQQKGMIQSCSAKANIP
ncbi:MAG: hypothetical protein DRR16_20960 [Candidatus Parabeggiatoa sp. nov. 3]|nr:MAG: hypothetical protein DRR00_28525 [Gammaproteobacteria bacterium]RKZ57461.1 MAG: hypothetical protein DRQ99_26935 [Gammaproteobacteria bacterium]RKZ81925.1 MAG: hypothetical protein DRR16_20960 [Gammaproteobacteria bacterium]